MCGIAGMAGAGAGMRSAEIDRMLQTLARRGPDGCGIHAWNEAVFGHRRLAIFDLTDAGRQPMLSPDGRIGVTFNGAIYNFGELRAELSARGYTFVSRTDTEVLIHGYDAWGIDGLVERLHGMFALALWDDRSRTLYLVRDRLGVKPLLFAINRGVLAFASTAAALADAGWAGDLDPQAVAEFLEFGFVTDDRCIYQGVRKLKAGHIAQWRDGILTVRRYWAPNTPQPSTISFEEAVEETERLLLRAVQLRLEADVPVAALLSSGIDSGLVCWAIKALGADVTAYTVGTPGDPWDESGDAVQTAGELGIAHRVLPLAAHSAPTIDDLIAAYGEPFACGSVLGMLAISNIVREHAKVLLTGDGGDDVLLGYPRNQHYFLAQRLARMLPPGSTTAWNSVRALIPKSGPARRAVHFMDYATSGFPAVISVWEGLPFYSEHHMFGERLANVKLAHHTAQPSVHAARHIMEDHLAFELRTYFVSEFMPKVDGSTMYHGLEARAPMLDQRLWEYASALPYGLRLRGGKLKAILREIARRRISARVANGVKRGFGVPVQRWLTTRWRADFENAFRDSVLETSGWIESEPVLRVMSTLKDGDTAPDQLWYLYVLEHWMRQQSTAQRIRDRQPQAARTA
jgi:asparagine synthase (glutamine-hydrolysing)